MKIRLSILKVCLRKNKNLKLKNILKKILKIKKTKFAILRYFNVAGASKSGKIGQISKGDQLFKIYQLLQ